MIVRTMIPDTLLTVIVDGTHKEWSNFIRVLGAVLEESITDVDNALLEVEEDEWEAVEWLDNRRYDLARLVDFVGDIRRQLNEMLDSLQIEEDN